MADVGALFSGDLYLMPLLEVDCEPLAKYCKPRSTDELAYRVRPDEFLWAAAEGECFP